MSNKLFLSADLHLGHRRIIDYSNRPFVDVEEMNRVIIERWNQTVGETDTVWFLGDLCWTGHQSLFHRLNGIKHLIIGNHDERETVTLPWASQPQYYQELSFKEGEYVPTQYARNPAIILSHYGMRSWKSLGKGSIMLHGHSHNNLPGFQTTRGGGTLDVGVDCWDFYPVSIDQIKARITTLPEYSPEIHEPRKA